jgi:hypothetical protein
MDWGGIEISIVSLRKKGSGLGIIEQCGIQYLFNSAPQIEGKPGLGIIEQCGTQYLCNGAPQIEGKPS